MDALTPLSEIAEVLGTDKSNARRYALRKGFVFVRARMLTAGGRQPVLALTKKEFQRLVKIRKSEGFPVKGEAEEVRLIQEQL